MELSTALHPTALSLDGVVFKPTIGPECHVLPIGASALAEYLSTMADLQWIRGDDVRSPLGIPRYVVGCGGKACLCNARRAHQQRDLKPVIKDARPGRFGTGLLGVSGIDINYLSFFAKGLL